MYTSHRFERGRFMTKTKAIKLENPRSIHDSAQVRVIKTNHIVEVMHMTKDPVPPTINYKKLDKDRYYCLLTGEIFEYKKSDNKSQSVVSIKKTLTKLKRLINNNFTGERNELFLTLTYGKTMTDCKQLMKDFDTFMKRLKRKYPQMEYINVIEPQGSGSWHCHVLLKDMAQQSLYIHNSKMAEMWGHGFTSTKGLKKVDNIGAYLGGYISDLEIADENTAELIESTKYSPNGQVDVVEREVENDDGTKTNKKFAKGARLHMYPSGVKFYRCSRGIKHPEAEKMIFADVKKIVGYRTPNYEKTIRLQQIDTAVPLNNFTYQQYNLKRQKGKA